MKKGFTMAEVLITIGIIGVVAAMTLPSVLGKYKEKQTVTQLKRFYSIMSNAFMLAFEEQGEFNYWGVVTSDNNQAANDFKNRFISYLRPYLHIIYECKFGDNECENDDYQIVSLDGTPHTLAGTKFLPHLVLNDGSAIVHLWFSGSERTTIYGEVYVDLNGSKAPNKLGEDIFVFGVKTKQFYPYGLGTATSFTFEKTCQINKTGRMNGYGCAGWVLNMENMNYLHCNGLSWNGKTKCK